MFFNGRSNVIKFMKVFGSMIFEPIRKAIEGIGLKILTSKQMPQRLPTALAQVKPGSNSKSFLTKSDKLSILYIN